MRPRSTKYRKPKGEGGVRLALLLSLAFTIPLLLVAAPPDWWQTRGVVATNATTNDFAPVNQGQVKKFAAAAVAEMNEKLAATGGAGTTLNNLVSSWQSPAAQVNDYAPLNVGQLKALAKPFYNRLGISYPAWGTTANDYAPANIGQVKNLFSFTVDASTAKFDAVVSDPAWPLLTSILNGTFTGSLTATQAAQVQSLLQTLSDSSFQSALQDAAAQPDASAPVQAIAPVVAQLTIPSILQALGNIGLLPGETMMVYRYARAGDGSESDSSGEYELITVPNGNSRGPDDYVLALQEYNDVSQNSDLTHLRNFQILLDQPPKQVATTWAWNFDYQTKTGTDADNNPIITTVSWADVQPDGGKTGGTYEVAVAAYNAAKDSAEASMRNSGITPATVSNVRLPGWNVDWTWVFNYSYVDVISETTVSKPNYVYMDWQTPQTPTTIRSAAQVADAINNGADGSVSLMNSLQAPAPLSETARDWSPGQARPSYLQWAAVSAANPSVSGGWNTLFDSGDSSKHADFPTGNMQEVWLRRTDRTEAAMQQPITYTYLKVRTLTTKETDAQGNITYATVTDPEHLPQAVTLTIDPGNTVSNTVLLEARAVDDHSVLVQESLAPLEIVAPNTPVSYTQPAGPTLLAVGSGSGSPAADSSGGDNRPDPPAPDPAALAPPQPDIMDMTLKPAQTLNVAKMEQAIKPDANGKDGWLDIDADPDRFYIRIKAPKELGKISIFITTTGDNVLPEHKETQPIEEELEYDGLQGEWRTQSQLLISDQQIDNRYQTDDRQRHKVPPNAKNDRTHVVELGGKLQVVKMKIGDEAEQQLSAPLTADVPIKREIGIRVVYMENVITTGSGAVDIAGDIKVANERFAQVGVKFKVLSGPSKLTWPAGLSHGGQMPLFIKATERGSGSNQSTTLGSDAKLVIDHYNQTVLSASERVSDKDILVVYCQNIFYVDANTPVGQDASGFASFRSWTAGPQVFKGGSEPPCQNYANKAFVASGSRHKPYSLAHELGHLLTDHGHFGVDYAAPANPNLPQPRIEHNLMRNGTSNQMLGITDSKRLYDNQNDCPQQQRILQWEKQ